MIKTKISDKLMRDALDFGITNYSDIGSALEFRESHFPNFLRFGKSHNMAKVSMTFGNNNSNLECEYFSESTKPLEIRKIILQSSNETLIKDAERLGIVTNSNEIKQEKLDDLFRYVYLKGFQNGISIFENDVAILQIPTPPIYPEPPPSQDQDNEGPGEKKEPAEKKTFG